MILSHILSKPGSFSLSFYALCSQTSLVSPWPFTNESMWIYYWERMPKLGTVLQMKPHECWVDGDNIFSWPPICLWIINTTRCILSPHFCNGLPLSCSVTVTEDFMQSCSLVSLHDLCIIFLWTSWDFCSLFIQIVKVSPGYPLLFRISSKLWIWRNILVHHAVCW